MQTRNDNNTSIHSAKNETVQAVTLRLHMRERDRKVKGDLDNKWRTRLKSMTSAICQMSPTVSTESSPQHFWDPCIFCSRTGRHQQSRIHGLIICAIQLLTPNNLGFKRDLKTYNSVWRTFEALAH